MFSNIAFGFCWIPLESHIYILLYFKYGFAEFEESLSEQGGAGVAAERVGLRGRGGFAIIFAWT